MTDTTPMTVTGKLPTFLKNVTRLHPMPHGRIGFDRLEVVPEHGFLVVHATAALRPEGIYGPVKYEPRLLAIPAPGMLSCRVGGVVGERLVARSVQFTFSSDEDAILFKLKYL